MLQQTNPFGLLVPLRKASSAPAESLRSKDVATWLKHLPLANPESLAHLLYRRIAVENRAEHKPQDRLRFIEQLRTQVLYCTDHFREQLVKSSLPMNSRNLKRVSQARTLLTELTNAYKITITDLLQAKRIDKKAVALACQRATHCLTRILEVNYACYIPAPQHIWVEIHRIYHISESHGLLAIKLRDDVQQTRHTSVDLEYKRILLLSLANPYRLRRADIKTVSSALKDWAREVDIEKSANFANEKPCFVVDLESDQAPNQIQHNNVTERIYNRFINLDRLNTMLRECLQSCQQSQDQTCQVNHDTLHKLLLTWEMNERRSFKRSTNHAGLGITIGINNTYDEIDCDIIEKSLLESDRRAATGEASSPQPEQVPPLELIDIQTSFSLQAVEEEQLAQDPWDKRHLIQQPTQQATDHEKPIAHKLADRFGPSKQTWKMINISAGGYCIMWDQDTPNPAQIGEIVGVLETSQSGVQNWNIGIVRWIEYQPGNGLKMGIQVLAPNAVAVTTCPYGRKNPDREKTLQLPELAVIDQPASLVTSYGHYQIGDRLIVDNHGHTTVVQLSGEIEHTGNITRFRYNELNNRAVASKPHQASTTDTQEIVLSDFPDEYLNWPTS